jgi:predicted MFS family arabinose efflux permease
MPKETVAAITLGIMGPRAFTRRIGRNESFNHAGNALAAALAGICAWKWGPIVVFYLLAILSLRGFLYPLSDDRYWLFAVQSLDGVGAGLYGALFPLIVADLTRGTGHFNLAQGAVITAQGIGAALSTSLAGLVVVHAGYSAAFLVLAGIAASGFLLYFFGMPETRDLAERGPDQFAPAVQTR